MSSDESNQPKKSFELSHLPIVLKAFQAGVQAALTDHKRRQESVVVWRDGKVVEVEPEDIPDFSSETPKSEQEKPEDAA
jgi:hypothetical protein